jgi:hypothetical protein
VRLGSLANRNFLVRLARIITNFNSGALRESCENFGSNTNFSLWIMISLVCESPKLHDILYFSLLPRLALIFSWEASLIFHKKFSQEKLRNKTCCIPYSQYRFAITKDNFSRHLHRIKRKIVKFIFLLQVFFVFAIFVFRETRLFRNLGIFAKLRNSLNLSLMFAKHENRFVASFAKFSRNEISSKTLHPIGLTVARGVGRCPQKHNYKWRNSHSTGISKRAIHSLLWL